MASVGVSAGKAYRNRLGRMSYPEGQALLSIPSNAVRTRLRFQSTEQVFKGIHKEKKKKG